MKKKGFKDAENKMSRDSSKKMFGLKYGLDGKGFSLTEVTCETDFVAKTNYFIEFSTLIQNYVLN